MKKILTIILCTISVNLFALNEDVYDKFVTNDLSINDINTIKNFSKQKQFAEYYNIEYTSAPKQYIDNINGNMDTYDIKKIYLSKNCSAMLINQVVSGVNIQYDGKCYIYGYSKKERNQMIEYVNINTIITDAQPCSISQSCTVHNDNVIDKVNGKLRQADLQDVYATMVTYLNKCQSSACRTNVALIAYMGGDYYANIINHLIPNYPDISPTYSNDIVVSASRKYITSSNGSYIYGFSNVINCQSSIIAHKLGTLNTCLMNRVLIAKVYNINYDEIVYAKAVADGKTFVSKYKPSIAQVDLINKDVQSRF